MNTMEAAKKEVKTETAQPAMKGIKLNCKNNNNIRFWKTEVHKMGSYKILALFIIFGMLLSAMWSRLTSLMVIAIRMSGHLKDRGTWSNRREN
jgi:hypothetical protein